MKKSLLTLIPLLFLNLIFSQSVDVKDSNNETLIAINDEGTNNSSLTLQNSTAAPSTVADKLYNVEHSLFWNGSALSTSNGDNLGSHTATQDLDMAGFDINLNGGFLSGDGDAEGIYVNSTGIVDMDSQSRARAYLIPFQNIPLSEWTPIEFSYESFDEQQEFTKSSGPDLPGYFTATREGYYQINARTEFSITGLPNQVAGFVTIAIFINSTIYAEGNRLQMVKDNELFSSNDAPIVSDIVFLQSGDVVGIYVYQNINNPTAYIMSGANKTYVSIHKIS